MKRLLYVLVAVAVAACSSMGTKYVQGDSVNEDRLVHVANEIKAEMRRIVQIESGYLSSGKSGSSLPKNMNRLVSIDYDGDIQTFMEDVQATKLFDVRITGRHPVQDVVVSLHHKNQPIWKVLEDAGTQIGRFGTITVTPSRVSLDYAKIQ